MTHIIVQTGYVEFFNNLTWLSASLLSLANKDDTYVVFGFVKASTKVVDGLKKTGHANARFVDMTDFQNISISDARQLIDKVLRGCQLVKTLNIFNGACNSFACVEDKHYKAWQEVSNDKHNMLSRFKLLKDVAESPYQQIMWLLYELIESAKMRCLETLQINNFVEDPLQHKLWQFESDIVHIKHWYFHKLNNLQQQYEHDWDEKHASSIITNFDFSPSQQHFYWHGVSANNLFRYEDRKHLVFAFAMTNVWKDRQERTIMIDEMLHLHCANAIKHGIVFRFFSRAKHQQMLSDKLLSYATYLELLKSSRFTLIIPSYDSNCFSMRRFAEAISVGCVPLIHEDCKLYMFDETQKQFIEEHLLLTRQTIASLQNEQTLIDWTQQVCKNWERLLLACHTLFVKPYSEDSIYFDNLRQCKLLD